jgi:hypothetical protein
MAGAAATETRIVAGCWIKFALSFAALGVTSECCDRSTCGRSDKDISCGRLDLLQLPLLPHAGDESKDDVRPSFVKIKFIPL